MTVDYLMRGEGRVLQKISVGNAGTVARDNDLLTQGWHIVRSHFADSESFPSYMLVFEKTEYDA